MRVFDTSFMDELTALARAEGRRRQHRNVHKDYQEPCQRLFNAIEPGSYIRPHRHASDPRNEMLVAVRGLMALFAFDDNGEVRTIVRLGAEEVGTSVSRAVEIEDQEWHTVIALEPGSMLLEIKAGPFDPSRPKDLAPWAPAEASRDADAYMALLQRLAESW
jgi:cupin fold WbuC family metalloprotein